MLLKDSVLSESTVAEWRMENEAIREAFLTLEAERIGLSALWKSKLG
jgi:hypothetical protein